MRSGDMVRKRILFIAGALIATIGFAYAESYSQCTEIPAAGGNIPGERYRCDECFQNGPGRAQGCVKCGTVTIRVPPDEQVVSKSRTGRLDWAAWLDEINVNSQSDGSIRVSTGAKNWSENMTHPICL